MSTFNEDVIAGMLSAGASQAHYPEMMYEWAGIVGGSGNTMDDRVASALIANGAAATGTPSDMWMDALGQAGYTDLTLDARMRSFFLAGGTFALYSKTLDSDRLNTGQQSTFGGAYLTTSSVIETYDPTFFETYAAFSFPNVNIANSFSITTAVLTFTVKTAAINTTVNVQLQIPHATAERWAVSSNEPFSATDYLAGTVNIAAKCTSLGEKTQDVKTLVQNAINHANWGTTGEWLNFRVGIPSGGSSTATKFGSRSLGGPNDPPKLTIT